MVWHDRAQLPDNLQQLSRQTTIVFDPKMWWCRPYVSDLHHEAFSPNHGRTIYVTQMQQKTDFSRI